MRYLITFFLIYFSACSYADKEYEELELLSYRMSSAFSAFIFFEGQQEYLDQAQQFLNAGNVLLKQTDEAHPELQKIWEQAVKFITQHGKSYATGVNNSREANWVLISQDIHSTLSRINNNNYSSEKIRLQLEMEQILALYMKFINAASGGYGISQAEITIDDRVKKVSDILQKESFNNRQLKRKWNYIKRTLLSYNTNAAPYIVMKVFDDMREIIRN